MEVFANGGVTLLLPMVMVLVLLTTLVSVKVVIGRWMPSGA